MSIVTVYIIVCPSGTPCSMPSLCFFPRQKSCVRIVSIAAAPSGSPQPPGPLSGRFINTNFAYSLCVLFLLCVIWPTSISPLPLIEPLFDDAMTHMETANTL
jgi:hypothetical protein